MDLPAGTALTPRRAALLILIGAAAALGGALVFEHGFGLRPCKLCLTQRIPYYVALPLGLVTILLPKNWGRLGLGLLAATFLVSAGLGVYHAGVEWSFWLGPNDCGGAVGAAPASLGDFLGQLETTRVVNCSEAAWRFLGLSLAGWNALISLGLAGVAVGGLLRRDGTYGSSSLSQ